MSVCRYIVLVCECEELHFGGDHDCSGESDAWSSVAATRRDAKARGWRRSRGKDFCPSCAAALERRAS